MNGEKFITPKRLTGLGLILFSTVGIAVFNIYKIDGVGVFYLSFGWGLAMLL